MPLSFWRKTASDWRTRLWLSALLLVLGLAAGRLELFRELEWRTEGALLRLRSAFGPAPHEDLRLVGIDDDSIREFGQWPFLRSYHYTLLERLGKDPATRPAVLSWDIPFVDRVYEWAFDQAFADVVRALEYPVVFGASFDPEALGLKADGELKTRPVPLARVSERPELAVLPDHRGARLPLPVLLEAGGGVAFSDAEPDSDGVVRRVPLVVRVGDEVFPGLVLETLLRYWKLNYSAVEIQPGVALVVRDGDRERARVPIDAQGCHRLNHRHEHSTPERPRGLPTLGYAEVYNALQARYAEGRADATLPGLGGKIVLVGQVATRLTDIGPSPLSDESAKVMVHLNALDNILRADYRRDLPLAPVLVGALFLGLGLGWMLEKRGVPALALGAFVAAARVRNAAAALLVGVSVMTPLALPLGALLLQQAAFATLKAREEEAKRDRIRGMFATYVAPALVDRMQRGEEPRLGGVEEEITAYFSDIESFSSFAEQLSPPRLVELMNEYLSACTEIVQAEGGTLDKYIGDALVAMYGAPLPLPHHGHRAVVAALRVHERCAELRAKWRAEQAEKGWPEIVAHLQTRIGLNLGPAVVGNMGSDTRFNYTMMGDTVNLAARMESGAKVYGVYTLVTESVVEASRRAEPGAVIFRPLDRIVVKGRTQPVAIFEAMALRASVGDAARRFEECAGHFAAGMDRYYRQDWEGARARFARSAMQEVYTLNNPSKVMLARIELMQARPPGKDWDGVWRMTTK